MEKNENSLHIILKALAENLDNALKVAGSKFNGEASKLTQKEINEKTGIARSTISNILNQKSSDISIKTLCKLADTLNIPPYLLLMAQSDVEKFRAVAEILSTYMNSPENRIDSLYKQIIDEKYPERKVMKFRLFCEELIGSSKKGPFKANSIEAIIQRKAIGNFIISQRFRDQDEHAKFTAVILAGLL